MILSELHASKHRGKDETRQEVLRSGSIEMASTPLPAVGAERNIFRELAEAAEGKAYRDLRNPSAMQSLLRGGRGRGGVQQTDHALGLRVAGIETQGRLCISAGGRHLAAFVVNHCAI
jgi:hypothetical protein